MASLIADRHPVDRQSDCRSLIIGRVSNMDKKTALDINQRNHSLGNQSYPRPIGDTDLALLRLPGPEIPLRSNSRATHILIVGVLLLQVIVTVTVLLLLAPIESTGSDQEIADALHVPLPGQEQSALPPSQPFPDDDSELPASTATRLLIATATPTSQPTAQVPAPVPAQPVAVRWRGLELTQGIQVFNEPEHPRCVPDPNHFDYLFCNNSMPMVAGRHTLLRAYPACNGDIGHQ